MFIHRIVFFYPNNTLAIGNRNIDVAVHENQFENIVAIF